MTELRRLLWFVFFTFICCAQSDIAGGETNRPKPRLDSHGQWVLQSDYSDEFNETKLDSVKWNNDVGDWGLWSWEPENAWVENGSLNLRMQYQKHHRGKLAIFYTSGIIKSRATPIKYGYFEARIKAAQRFPGVCPAFWVYRNDKDEWTEIDFAELTQRPHQDVKTIGLNSHVFLTPKLAQGKTIHEARDKVMPWDPRDDFHVYGCQWDEKTIKWYVDGKLLATRKNDYWQQPLDVVLSVGLRHPLTKTPSDKEFPTAFQADYIRVWKKATPNKPDAGNGK
jgi:kappa-carrageenase